MKRVLLASIVGTSLIAGGVFVASDLVGARAPSPVPGAEHTAAPGAVSEQRVVALRVDNMSCASCPYMVERALEGTPGVVAAEVSFRERRARVTYDSSRTEVAALLKATSDIGYPSRIVSE